MAKQELKVKESYLSFQLEAGYYAVSVKKVLEVVEKQRITSIPKAPDYVRGVINFRGEIIPVIELRKKMLLPSREEDKKFVIIVFDLMLKNEAIRLGAVVDGVKDVLEISDDQIKPMRKVDENFNTDFIIGIVSVKDHFIIFLDVDKVFTQTEVIKIQAITAENILQDKDLETDFLEISEL